MRIWRSPVETNGLGRGWSRALVWWLRIRPSRSWRSPRRNEGSQHQAGLSAWDSSVGKRSPYVGLGSQRGLPLREAGAAVPQPFFRRGPGAGSRRSSLGAPTQGQGWEVPGTCGRSSVE